MISVSDLFPYKFDKRYSKPVAYFSMEFAIDQSLKIYSGGLGFLAGSHMRSAYELKQNVIGIGILWKYGYYDQERNQDGTLRAGYVQKDYSFLTDTGIVFPITIHSHTVNVKVFLLKPEVFKTAPVFLLCTDIPENDHLAQTICYRLYDSHESARIAQSILLGAGGARLLDVLERETEVYHMNEGHALPMCFYLLNKYKDLAEVQKRVVFTTHTPEKAGNEEHAINTLEVMSFFQGAGKETVQALAEPDTHSLSYTLAALRMSRMANGVSAMHGEVSRKMWKGYERICNITNITNAQNKTYWQDKLLTASLNAGRDNELILRKKEMKRDLFRVVANQTGKLFADNVLTIVWARRFAAYKRANLLMRDFDRFKKLVTNKKYPVQIIWAGKPYPEDHDSIHLFNDIIKKTKEMPNCAVLMGYEMELSALLKKGSDVWLNNPRMYHEASGTSGMTAAMNGSINVSIPDGWVPEFSKHKVNCFIIEPAADHLQPNEQDEIECENLLKLFEKVIVPMYYDKPKDWLKVMKQSMKDILLMFDAGRMAHEYYEKMYQTASAGPLNGKANSKRKKEVAAV